MKITGLPHPTHTHSPIYLDFVNLQISIFCTRPNVGASLLKKNKKKQQKQINYLNANMQKKMIKNFTGQGGNKADIYKIR